MANESLPNLGGQNADPEGSRPVPDINVQMARIDNSANKSIDIDCSVPVADVVTLSTEDFQTNGRFVLRDDQGGSPAGPTAAFTLAIPANVSRSFRISNKSGQTATIDTTASPALTVDVPDGVVIDLVSDGIDVEADSSPLGSQTVFLPAASAAAPVTAGAGALVALENTSGRPNLIGRPFDGATEENLQYVWFPPQGWDGGTISCVVPYGHVGGQTTGLDGTAWEVKAVAVSATESLDVAFGTGVTVTLDAANAYSRHDPPAAVVTIGGTPAKGDLVMINVARIVGDAADDLNIDAVHMGLRITFTRDAVNDG